MLAGQESRLHVTLQGQGLTADPTSIPSIVISSSLQHFSMVPADTQTSLCDITELHGHNGTESSALCDQIRSWQKVGYTGTSMLYHRR